MLLVRASMLATLKTLSAKRRIPLWSVMPEFELQILMGYWKYRREHIHIADALFFSYLQTPTIPMPQSLLFDPVSKSFQVILGNRTPAFRFHHLRHSFANWMLLALFGLFFRILQDRPPFWCVSLCFKTSIWYHKSDRHFFLVAWTMQTP